jgi:hypothetical protein
MAIVGNRYYNDPNIGQAFSNLADIFAPPSGGDLAGYATAAATKEKAARLAELFAYAKDPNYNQTMADRLGVMGGLYAPNQSYYSVDQGNITDRRGQDIGAMTSRLNNQADNARAAWQTRYGPLSENQILPALPEEVAKPFGLPASDAIPGIVNVDPGETSVLPSGKIINGQPIPLTDAQMKAKILSGLPADEQRAAALDNTPVEVIVDPVTQQPTVQWRANSIGQRSYEKSAEPTEISKLIAERDALPANDPRRMAYDQRIQALGRGQQQSQYDKTNDEELAKLNAEIYKNGQQSFVDANLLATIQQAINDPNTPQGALGPTTLAMQKYLQAFGIDAGKTAPAEMVNALGSVLALRLRDPSNGAGMPGALSDSDRAFLQSMVASLGNTPDANRQIVSYYMKLQQKNADLENLRRAYVSEHGRIDEGFRNQVSDYMQKSGLAAANAQVQNAGQAQQPANATQAEQPGVEVWDFVDGKLQRVK